MQTAVSDVEVVRLDPVDDDLRERGDEAVEEAGGDDVEQRPDLAPEEGERGQRAARSTMARITSTVMSCPVVMAGSVAVNAATSDEQRDAADAEAGSRASTADRVAAGWPAS